MEIWRNKRYLCTRNKRKTPLEADKKRFLRSFDWKKILPKDLEITKVWFTFAVPNEKQSVDRLTEGSEKWGFQKSFKKIWRLQIFDLPLQSQTKKQMLIVWETRFWKKIKKNLSKRLGGYKNLIYLCIRFSTRTRVVETHRIWICSLYLLYRTTFFEVIEQLSFPLLFNEK